MCALAAEHQGIRIALLLHIFFNTCRELFQVIRSREQGIVEAKDGIVPRMLLGVVDEAL